MSTNAISGSQSIVGAPYPEPIQKRATCCALGAKVGVLVLAGGYVFLVAGVPLTYAPLFAVITAMAGVPKAYKKYDELAARYFNQSQQ